MRKKFSSPAFTIIEILIVLSVIAVVAALALPKLGGAANQRELEMVTQNMVSDIRLVQQLAINSGGLKECAMYSFTEKTGQQYYLIRDGSSEMKRVYLPKTVKWANVPKIIQFNVTGAPGGSSSQTIRMESSGSKPLFIKIAPVTGRVRITDVESARNE